MSRPRLDNVGRIFYQPSFWIIAILMSLACGASVGVYSILPVYLISEQGLDQGLVNTLVGLSRISGLVTVFLAGWLADHFGAKRVMGGIYIATAILTGLMGFGQKIILVVVVFLQPAVVAAFFPGGVVGTGKRRPAPHSERCCFVDDPLCLPIWCWARPRWHGGDGGILRICARFPSDGRIAVS